MTAYYTGMIYLTCFAMGIMALIVQSSDWLDREKQRQFQVIFATVVAAAGAEWLTVLLDGSGPGLRWLHLGVKVLELSIAPFVAVEFLRALDAEGRARQLKWLLIVHVAVELAAAPFGLIVAFEEVEPIVEAITPVPGGVGSVTSTVLVGHVVEAAMRRLWKDQ